MLKLKLIFALALLGTLAGCEVDEGVKQSQNAKQVTILSSDRFKIERVSIFRDRLAYGTERGVYVITDTETGQEFVGVSGVGISELGVHKSGKTQISDER